MISSSRRIAISHEILASPCALLPARVPTASWRPRPAHRLRRHNPLTDRCGAVRVDGWLLGLAELAQDLLERVDDFLARDAAARKTQLQVELLGGRPECEDVVLGTPRFRLRGGLAQLLARGAALDSAPSYQPPALSQAQTSVNLPAAARRVPRPAKAPHDFANPLTDRPGGWTLLSLAEIAQELPERR